jgi:hypothetical protein
MSFLSFSSNHSEVKQPAQPAFVPHTLLVAKKKQNVTRLSRKGKGKGKKSKGMLSRLGDMTLRDAADLTGGIIKGGLSIATSLFNVEEKVLDTSASTTYTSSGTVTPLSLMAQGSDYNQRDGLSIRARNLVLNFYGVWNGAGSATQAIRIIVFQDLENQAATPAVTAVLESASIVSPFLHYVGDRYRVFYDHGWVMTSSTPSGMYRVVCPIDSHITFKSTTAAAADAWNGQLYTLIISDQGATPPTLVWYSRLSFVDN